MYLRNVGMEKIKDRVYVRVVNRARTGIEMQISYAFLKSSLHAYFLWTTAQRVRKL